MSKRMDAAFNAYVSSILSCSVRQRKDRLWVETIGHRLRRAMRREE